MDAYHIPSGYSPDFDPSHFAAARVRAYARHGRRADAIDVARRAEIGTRCDALARDVRGDAFDAGAAGAMARDLEHTYAEVLREEYPANNAFRLFPIDTSVPVGATTHRVKRVYDEGEARWYRGGDDVPRVGWNQREEIFPVRHAVSSFVVNMFERQSAGFAGFNDAGEKLRICRDVVASFLNRKFWNGDEAVGLYGVLNYPWLPKKVVATPFTDASGVDAIVGELNALANFPEEQSEAVFAPNAMVTSPRLANYLANRRIGDAVDNTIARFWLQNNAQGITQIDKARELQGAGPGGTDGILLYRRDRRGVTLVMPQPFTVLPAQKTGFDDVTYAWADCGGVIMRDVGNNILGWVDMGD